MIRSTFTGFLTARTGIQVSQKGLDVTGQNITNANTPGYTRQRLDLYSVSSGGYAMRYAFKKSNEIGQGVTINGISQIRDQFLDVRFRRECARLGEVDSKLEALNDLESIFDETMVDGLSTQINNFIKQLQTYAGEVGNPEFDGIVRSSAELLTKLINQYSKQVNTVYEQQSYQFENIDIPRINDIFKEISQLNKSIREDQLYGNPALELKDSRNLLIDELSQYMPIDVKYNPVEVAPGIVVEDITISLHTQTVPAEYTTLMHNLDYVKITAGQDSDGKYQVFLDDGGTVSDITEKFTGGVVKGSLDALNKAGEFDSPASDFRGITYYTKMLDSLAQTFAETFNAANSYPNPSYDPSDPLSEQYLTDRPLFESNDGGPITAANLSVAQGWLKSEYGITTSKNPIGTGDTSGASDNLSYIITLFSKPLEFKAENGDTVFKGTIEEFVSQVSNVLALDIQSLSSISNSYASTVSGIQDLRDGVSAVNIDEEAINLLMYQKSYNAAARLMTAMDEALDILINKMGIVGR